LVGADTSIELLHDGQEVLLLRGGEGGKGNEHFKSSTNQRPMQCTKGKKGEEGQYSVELRLMADVGFIGLPNAGKSSLLNAFTNAGARVADYPFTTLDPNLGTYHGYVFADIPGLIEGASSGKGLGHKFLKHVTRTKVLVHCISLERDMLQDVYKTVRHELEDFEGLADKREFIVCTKSDLCTDSELTKRVGDFERSTGKKVLTSVSILDDISIKTLGDQLVAILNSGE
jgi:GTP-binding protein